MTYQEAVQTGPSPSSNADDGPFVDEEVRSLPSSPQAYSKLAIVPVSLSDANGFVARLHRHNRPVQGAKFCVGVADEETGVMRGIVIVGRTVARMLQDGFTLEVTRCCTDGCPNACSMLYNAARTSAFAQGYRKLVTYTLQSESTTALKAAGWELVAEVDPYPGKGWLSRPGRTEQPVSRLPKYRWETSARSERQRRIFPVILPWQQGADDPPARRVLIPPETLVFTGKGNTIDLPATVELTLRAITEETGGFSTWYVHFAVDIEIRRAKDCHLVVTNPPTYEEVERVLCQMAKRSPDQLISYGYGGYSWRAHTIAPMPPHATASGCSPSGASS